MSQLFKIINKIAGLLLFLKIKKIYIFFINFIIFLKAILKAFLIANNSALNTFIFNPKFHERLFKLFLLKLIV